LDRITLVVVILGVFLGLVYSLSLEASRYDLLSSETGEANSQVRGGSKRLLAEAEDGMVVTDSPVPPTKQAAGQDLGYDTEAYHDASRGPTFDDEWNTVPEAIEGAGSSQPTFIAVGDDGVLAYYVGTKTAINYSGYRLALLRFEGGAGGTLRESLESGNAVVVDETGSSLLLLVPEGWDAYLDSLLEDGTILSYEFGGLGTGLGKA
jgi:hypothetical protein